MVRGVVWLNLPNVPGWSPSRVGVQGVRDSASDAFGAGSGVAHPVETAVLTIKSIKNGKKQDLFMIASVGSVRLLLTL